MRNPSSDSHSQAGSNSPFLVKADTFEVFSQRNVWYQSWFLSLSLFWGFCLALFPNAMYWSMISHFLPHHHHRHQHPCEWNLPRSEFESRSPSSLSDKRRRPPNWIWWLGHHHLLASLVTIISASATWTIIVTSIATFPAVVTNVDIKWKTCIIWIDFCRMSLITIFCVHFTLFCGVHVFHEKQ